MRLKCLSNNKLKKNSNNNNKNVKTTTTSINTENRAILLIK